MAEHSAGTRALMDLNAIWLESHSVQQQVPPHHLAELWRATAREYPDLAVHHWEARNTLGSRIREEIPEEQAAELFARIPLNILIGRLMHATGSLERCAAKRLPRAVVVQIWTKFSPPLWALTSWDSRTALGDALRNRIGPDELVEAWHAVADDSLEDAINLWREPSEHLGPALRRNIDSLDLLRCWRETARTRPGLAARILDRGLEGIPIQLTDLALLATSTDEYARSIGISQLEQWVTQEPLGPQELEEFLEVWREIVRTKIPGAATLISASPPAVQARLTQEDLALLLQIDDREARLDMITKLRKEG